MRARSTGHCGENVVVRVLVRAACRCVRQHHGQPCSAHRHSLPTIKWSCPGRPLSAGSGNDKGAATPHPLHEATPAGSEPCGRSEHSHGRPPGTRQASMGRNCRARRSRPFRVPSLRPEWPDNARNQRAGCVSCPSIPGQWRDLQGLSPRMMPREKRFPLLRPAS